MSAAEIAERLRIEQIRADIARTTQELLCEPRKYRVQFAAAIISACVGGAVVGAAVAYNITAHQAAPRPIVIQLLQAPK